MADGSFDYKLSGEGLGQTTAETCWYASYAIVYNWASKPISSIADRIKKAGYDYDDYYKNGLPIPDFHKVGAALGMTTFRGSFISNLADDFQSFADLLQRYGPLWCAFARPSAHILVVSGVDSGRKQVHIINPWNRLGGYDADGQYLDPGTFKLRLNSADNSVGQTIG